MEAKREASLELLKEHLSIIATKGPVEKLGEAFEEAEKCFQAVGCSDLLLFADQDRFRRNLVWAAFTRRRFLVRCRDDGVADFRLASSRSDALFCALSAADLTLAKEIVDLSPTSWIPEGEYEDDFAYHAVLHLFVASADAAAIGTALDTLERTLGESPRARLDVCRALSTRDAVAFNDAMRVLLESIDAEMPAARRRFADDPTFEPRSYVSVEGLALLRLAVERNLMLDEEELPLCPSIGRLLPESRRPDDIIIVAEQA
jgi:hypothetical protein